jgi:hypothetical protein
MTAFSKGAPVPGATAQEAADEIATDPSWRFATNPPAALGHASSRAAQAYGLGHPVAAAWWTSVLALLVAASPSVDDLGEVGTGLVARYGINPSLGYEA